MRSRQLLLLLPGLVALSCLLPEAGLVDSLGQGGAGGTSVAAGGAGSGGVSVGGDGAGGSSGSQGGSSISGQTNGGSSSAGGGAGGAGGAGGTSLATGGGGSGGTISLAGGAAGVAGGLAGGGGGGGALIDVAAVLDGQKYLLPCGANLDVRTCNNTMGGTCPNNPDYIFDGAVNRNDTVQFGGTAGVVYNVTIRVRGIVESRSYTGGSQETGGWYAGGAPPTNVAFNVYLLRVSSPAQDYFLNSLPNPGEHSTFVVDYEATFPIEGGAQVQFVLSDSNCLAFRNCASPDGPNCFQQSIPTLAPEYPEIAQPYNGQFLVIDVVSVTSG